MKRKKICSIITAAVVTASLTIQSGYQVMAIEKPSVKSLASSVRSASDNKLELKMNTSNTNSTSNSIALQYTLKNTSSEAVDLAGVKINYYYSSDEDKKQNFVCDYSGGMVGGSYKGLTQCIQGTVAKTGLEDPTKSDCIGVGFSSDAGSLLPGEEIQIQIRVYRDDWSNYDQSNDYSFNDANKVEVSVNGSVNPPVNPPQKKDAKLTSTQGTFDKAEPKDLNVGMELNGNTLKSIKNDTTNKELVANSDYKSTTSNTALLKEYLNKLEVGTYTLSFVFDNNTVTYTVNIVDTSVPAEDQLGIKVGDVKGEAGETVSVPVELTNVPEKGLYGYSFTIKYDNTKFDGVKVTPTDLNPSAEDNFIATVDEKAGTIKISYVSSQIDDSETIFTDGKIADISFHIKSGTAEGTYKVDAVEGTGSVAYVNADYSTGSYDVKYNDGSISVQPSNKEIEVVTVKADNAKVEAGSTVTVPVSIDTTSTKGVYGYSFVVSYDNTKFDGVEVIPSDLNPSAEDNFIATVDEATGTIKISYVSSQIDDSETIKENGKIADIKLHAKETAAVGSTTLDIKEDTTSFAYVNSDYTPGSFVVEAVDGTVEITAKSTPKPEVVDSTLKVSKVTYDPEDSDEISVGVNFNGNKLVSINDGTKDLKLGEDYRVTSKKVVLSESYLQSLPQGKSANLTLKFSAGKDAKLEVEVLGAETPIIENSTINPTSIELTKGEEKDTTIALDLKGNTLKAIKDANGNAVKYTNAGSSVVLSKDYLASLKVGTTNLTFEFSAGENATLAVKVNAAKPVQEGQLISVDSIKAKAGDTITVPVKITGTPKEGIGCFSIELGFDTNYLEFVSATAGDIVTNAKSNFSADYFESDNIVSSFFTYNKKKSDQIVKDGTYMNVTFKVKAGVKGTTKLKVSEGNVISAKPSREDIPFTLSIGDIVIE